MISRLSLATLLVPLLAACSNSPAEDSGGGGGTSGPGAFVVVGVNFLPGQAWALNRPVDITLSQAVDPASLSANTVQLLGLGDAGVHPAGSDAGYLDEDLPPALGTLSLAAPDVVRFTPACPTGAGAQGAGLQPGRLYRLRLPAAASGLSLLSAAGAGLEEPFARTLTTPFSGDPGQRYDDALPGPPALQVRAAGSSDMLASYLEIGEDPLARVYFERDSAGNVALPAGFLAPLNTYADSATRVDLLLRFDQPLDPDPANLARLRLEYDDNGTWRPFGTRASLEGDCGQGGTFVRLEPQGLLPQGTSLRVSLDAGLSDLAGEPTGATTTALPVATATAYDPGTLSPGDSADRIVESFATDALEAGDLALGARAASWGDGRLQAAPLGFEGTGGPGGDFDWHLTAGETVVFDTISTTIVGGPDGTPTTSYTVLNGILDLDDLRIEVGARLIVQGPNPLIILAKGDVVIEGELLAEGGDYPGIGALNTTNVPAFGAPGHAGGGRGGTGSYLTNASTPQGGPGFGAYNVPAGGGDGGESSYSFQGTNARRGAGGGGGRLGPDVEYRWMNTLVPCQALIGMDAEYGGAGGEQGLGAISQAFRAQGGAMGPMPFTDGDPGNDFVGLLERLDGSLVQGELAAPLPGTGGGAGGDASATTTWPLVPFNPNGDERGAAGGGGGGYVRVLALGQILVTETGRLSVNGGDGGGGENTSFFNRVGGGSGGGSAGFLSLESLEGVEVRGTASGAEPFYTDDANAFTHSPRALSALGGQGGAGRDNRGGQGGTGPLPWRCDSIPLERLEPLGVPPLGQTCFSALTQEVVGQATTGVGGDGGPGLIQIRVQDPLTDLSLPDATDPTQVSAPPPVGWRDGAFEGFLRPTLGFASAAQSQWIALGQARFDPSGVGSLPAFFINGLEPDGQVSAVSGQQDPGPALVPAAPLTAAPGLPAIGPSPFQVTFDAAGVSGFDDAYERRPELLLRGLVRLEDPATQETRDFVIASASYDVALDRLSVTVDGQDGPLTGFAPAGVTAALHPRDLALTDASGDPVRPAGSSVRLRFDATVAGPDGQPDPSQALSAALGDLPSDPSALNGAPWDFVRFRVDFELNPAAPEALPALDFVSLPFRF